MPRIASFTAAFIAFSLVCTAPAQTPADPGGSAGAIRIWGHGHRGQDYILTLLQAWQAAFAKTHPGVQFDDQLTGNASGLGGLFTNTADLALLDREASFIEVDAYQQGAGYDPFRIPVAHGSVATEHHAPALKIFVNAANPVQQLSLDQLDGIFDADHRRGAHAYKTWGDLGVTGARASHPIRVYTYELQSAEVQFFERAALKGSQKFACCLTLFAKGDGAADSADRQIAAAVQRDPDGLALMAMPAPALKAVALSATGASPAVLPLPASIVSEAYPLARTVFLYANRRKGSSLPANVAAFLEFIVSPEGQAIVARTGGYLPLSPEQAAQAREMLK